MTSSTLEQPIDKQLLGSKLLNDIQSGLTSAGRSIVEASQDDPDTWTDDMIRLGLGGAKNVGNVLNAPGIKQALQALGAPAWVAGKGLGWTLEKAGVDPRYGQIAGEVGEWFIPFWGAGKLVKAAGGGIRRVGALADIARGGGMAANVGTGIDKGDGLYKKLTNSIDGIVDDIVENPGVIYPPGSEAARLQETIQPSARIPPSGMTPKQTREWFAKFTRPRILEIGEELGGSHKELRRIAREQADEFRDMENTISELNHMWRVWAEGRSLGFENSQIVVKKMKDGTERLAIEAWKGKDKYWETFAAFNKDHIRAVINAMLPGGGLYGANMAANLEALFAAANRRKSNIFQLDDRILKNIGVPKNAETYIFRKLHPEYTKLERLIPTFWRESYVKNILNDYYESVWNAKTKKWKLTGRKRTAKMNQLVRKYTHLYRDKAFIEGLEGLQKDLDRLMQSNIARGISGKEIPEWMEDLTMPPGGFNSKDPWWLDLPIDARRRWKRAADQKRIQLMFDPEYRPSKGRYRIKPDD